MKWTLRLAEAEFGVAAETIKAGLVRDGLEVKRGSRKGWTTRQIAAAIFGDLKTERLLKTREERIALEDEKAVRRRELVPMAVAEGVIRSRMLPVRDLLLSAPAVLAAKANPSDPELARLRIQEWVDDGLRVVREGEVK